MLPNCSQETGFTQKEALCQMAFMTAGEYSLFHNPLPRRPSQLEQTQFKPLTTEGRTPKILPEGLVIREALGLTAAAKGARGLEGGFLLGADPGEGIQG